MRRATYILMVILSTAATWGMLASASARAQAMGPADVDVREACRQAVAGAYLQAYDQKQRGIAYLEVVGQALAATQAKLKDARRAEKTSRARLAASTFNVALAAQVDEAAAFTKLLEQQAQDYKNLQKKATSRLAEARVHEQRLRAEATKTFSFERDATGLGRGYPVHLVWSSTCPKNRHLCPLPPGEAAKLRTLRVGDELPEACRRYAGLSARP